MQQPALALPWLESLQHSLEPYPMAWPATVLSGMAVVNFLAVVWLAPNALRCQKRTISFHHDSLQGHGLSRFHELIVFRKSNSPGERDQVAQR